MESASLEAIEVLHSYMFDSIGRKGLAEQNDSPFIGLVQLQGDCFNASLVLLGNPESITFLAFLELGIVVLLLLVYLEQFRF